MHNWKQECDSQSLSSHSAVSEYEGPSVKDVAHGAVVWKVRVLGMLSCLMFNSLHVDSIREIK